MTSNDDNEAAQQSLAQVFGGPWSLIKTDVLEQYIRFFNTALKNRPSKSRPFQRVYIDAFAGSGAFRYIVARPRQTLFDDLNESQDVHPGSAQLALRAVPPFDQIYFIEQDKNNVAALERLIKELGHKAASVKQGDANEVLRQLCRPEHWRNRRGVIFLDPFGMNVDWSTLQLIANTRALDVWFLFSLGGTVRNLPRLASKLDAGKRAAVSRVLGTDEWFEEFYKAPPSSHAGLFGISADAPVARRVATVNDVEAYVRKRLLTIFAHVEPPHRLKARKNISLFSLFFAVSNRSGAAIDLAKRGAAHILKNA